MKRSVLVDAVRNDSQVTFVFLPNDLQEKHNHHQTEEDRSEQLGVSQIDYGGKRS